MDPLTLMLIGTGVAKAGAGIAEGVGTARAAKKMMLTPAQQRELDDLTKRQRSGELGLTEQQRGGIEQRFLAEQGGAQREQLLAPGQPVEAADPDVHRVHGTPADAEMHGVAAAHLELPRGGGVEVDERGRRVRDGAQAAQRRRVSACRCAEPMSRTGPSGPVRPNPRPRLGQTVVRRAP